MVPLEKFPDCASLSDGLSDNNFAFSSLVPPAIEPWAQRSIHRCF